MSGTDENKKVSRAAGVVSAATMSSRVLGFVRDLVIAYFFGAGASADGFFVAFRIPNLLRRLFAEGSLTIAFIPIFTEVLKKKGREEALLMARSTATLLAMILFAVCALGMIFADKIVMLVAAGFKPGGGSFELAVRLTRLCFPFLFSISLVAMAGGVLNSLGHFFAPAAAPALLNLCIIATAMTLSPFVDPPVVSLALGVLLGGFAQMLMQVPFLKAHHVPIKPAFRFNDPALKRVLKIMGPSAFGAAVYQIAQLINTRLASELGRGVVSYLYYADRLIQFPLGIFAIAVSAAVLPSLSRQAADGDSAALVQTMGHGLRLTWFINLPAMVGLIILAEPLVTLLFVRGQFTSAHASATAGAVMGYAAGLWAVAGVRCVAPAFFALKDIKTPVVVAAISLTINVILALILMKPYAHIGLALATSAAGVVNLVGLVWMLRRRLGRLGGRRIMASTLRICAACALMALAVWGLAFGIDWGDSHRVLYRLTRPLAAVAGGILVYLAAARIMRLDELESLLDMLRRR